MSFNIGNGKWGAPTLGTESQEVTWSASITNGLNYNTALYDQSDFDEALEAAFDAWESVAAVDFRQESSSATSDIEVFMEGLGGSTVGLAEVTYFELGAVDQYIEAEVSFDSNEGWSPYGETDLSFYAVALHEIGHVIGLGHVADTSEIMNSFVSANTLGDGDVEGAQEIYGRDAGDLSTPPAGPGPSTPPPSAPLAPASFAPTGGGSDEDDDDDDEGGFFGSLFGWIGEFFAAIFGGGDEDSSSSAVVTAPEEGEVETDAETFTIRHLVYADEASFLASDHAHDHAHSDDSSGGTGHAFDDAHTHVCDDDCIFGCVHEPVRPDDAQLALVDEDEEETALEETLI